MGGDAGDEPRNLKRQRTGQGQDQRIARNKVIHNALKEQQLSHTRLISAQIASMEGSAPLVASALMLQIVECDKMIQFRDQDGVTGVAEEKQDSFRDGVVTIARIIKTNGEVLPRDTFIAVRSKYMYFMPWLRRSLTPDEKWN